MKKWILIVLLAGGAPQIGCGDSDDNSTNTSANNEPAETTVIRGRLTADASGGGGVEGRQVSARFVDEDGMTGEVEADTTTNAEGEYRLTLREAVTSTTSIVIDAYDDTEQLGRVMVYGAWGTLGDLNAPPITLESTASTNVLITSRAEGFDCEVCSPASVEHRVDEDLAIVMMTLSEGEGSIYPEITESLYAGMDAHSRMMLDDTTETYAEQLDTALTTADEAYLILQAELHKAESAEDRAAARSAYATAYVESFLDAGISENDLAIAAHTETIARNAVQVTDDDEASAELLADAEARRSERVTAAVLTAFDTHGTTSDNIATANEQLRLAIEQSASAGADARAEIDDAWTTYANTIELELQRQFDANGDDIFSGFDSAFEVGVEAFVTSVNALDAITDMDARITASVAAVAALHNQVVSEDNIEELVEAGLDQDTARAYLEVVFHLRAVSTLGA